MYYLRGKFSKAIIQYQSCLREFDINEFGGDNTIHLLLSASYYRSKRFTV
jgi:hypothetical protein